MRSEIPLLRFMKINQSGTISRVKLPTNRYRNDKEKNLANKYLWHLTVINSQTLIVNCCAERLGSWTTLPLWALLAFYHLTFTKLKFKLFFPSRSLSLFPLVCLYMGFCCFWSYCAFVMRLGEDIFTDSICIKITDRRERERDKAILTNKSDRKKSGREL